MNRLVIIGNGFDLAHGLPTGYKDFILGYLRKCLLSMTDNIEYENNLVFILKVTNSSVDSLTDDFILHNLKNPAAERFNGQELSINKELKDMVLNQHKTEAPYNNFQYIICFKSVLLNQIRNSVTQKNWVDIETEYYLSLKKATSRLDNSVYDLNQTFQSLINELIIYLKQVASAERVREIDSYISGKIQQFESNGETKYFSIEKYPSEILLLNFNYTSNTEKYFDYHDMNSKKRQIQIHGNLDNGINPVIFGYGDEMDEEYKKLELHANKECLKFIKSFGYALTANYQKLINFVETDSFEVYIMGHSCGLSDRVMLNTLFEHENCKIIRIFYYQRKDGSTDFMDVYQNIARQFSLNKRSDFRKKVLPFEVSKPLPQRN